MNDTENEYLKLYCANLKDDYCPDDITLALASLMSCADKHDLEGGQLIFLTNELKKQICSQYNICMKTLNNTIANGIKSGIIRRVTRGVYQFNPFIFGKGDWDDIVVTQQYFKQSTGAVNDGTKHTE